MERHIDGCPRCQERAALAAGVGGDAAHGGRAARAAAAAARAADADRPRGGRSRRHAPARAARGRGTAVAGWAGCSRSRGPALALGAMLLAIAGGSVGYALGSGDGTDATTVQAQVDPSVAGARATLERDGDRGILRVSGLPQRREPDLRGVDRARQGGAPRGLFQVDRSGTGAAAIPTGPGRGGPGDGQPRAARRERATHERSPGDRRDLAGLIRPSI